MTERETEAYEPSAENQIERHVKLHMTERELLLLETIRGAKDPAAVIATVLKAISELPQQSERPDQSAFSAPEASLDTK